MRTGTRQRPDLRIGLIGTGYMGKAHTIGYAQAPIVFDLPMTPIPQTLCSTSEEKVRSLADQWHYRDYSTDWRAVVTSEHIDAVIIATPPHTHFDMAMTAIEAGKHVFCEKPLAMTASEALALAEAAEAAGVQTMVGYNYIKCPASLLAREMIEAGEIGDIIHVQATHVEDYMRDPEEAVGWRVSREIAGPAGALADVGSHIINGVLRLAGPFEDICAVSRVIYPERPDHDGQPIPVENDDYGHILARLRSGAHASITYSRVASGRKMGYAYEITGTRGAIIFSQEAMNEVHLFTHNQMSHREGFKRIMIGPEHPDYGQFSLGAGHGTGYNDMMTIEARDFIEAIHHGEAVWPTFRDGYEVDRIVDACLDSASSRAWVNIT